MAFRWTFPSIKWSLKHSVTEDVKKLEPSQEFQVKVKEIPMNHLFFKESLALPILSSSLLAHLYHQHLFYPLSAVSAAGLSPKPVGLFKWASAIGGGLEVLRWTICQQKRWIRKTGWRKRWRSWSLKEGRSRTTWAEVKGHLIKGRPSQTRHHLYHIKSFYVILYLPYSKDWNKCP